jgi:cytoskeletal protein CcmA (bactofilin family)
MERTKMFRPSKNPKDQPDETADHTRKPASYPTSSGPSTSSTSSVSTPITDTHPTQPSGSTSSRAVTESESLARDIKEGTLTGFVGNGTALTGEATFKGMLRVDGHLSGRVSSDDGTLIISTNGQVDANVEVAVAQIFGTVNGDIIASKRIEMGRVAKVTGNIQTPALVIESGAIFEGSCKMGQPAAAAKAPSATASTPAPTPSPSTPPSSTSSTSSSSSASPTSNASSAASNAAGTPSTSGSGTAKAPTN